MTTPLSLVERAESALTSSRILLDNEQFADSVSRSYYAMLQAAKALLLTKDSNPRTHAGIASELGNLFRNELGPDLTSAFSGI